MNSLTKVCLLLAMTHLMTHLCGCATFELEGSGSITPDATTGSETVHGSLYGFRWQESTVEKCGTDNLFRVEVHTNAALLLVAVATLGLYVPQTVEWWCHTPVDENADEEVWTPPAISSQEQRI